MPSGNLGLSLSIHRCEELGIDPQRLMLAAIKDIGCRKFRLMSYWDIHEPDRGIFSFRELDKQLNLAAKYGASVSLCLGKRQPRWPECHMPNWARTLPQAEWYDALFRYIELVVMRYKSHPALESWQLENEALMRQFGQCPDGDSNRARLRKEMRIIKALDNNHPVIMTLSDSWGLPWRQPKPAIYALSLYLQTTDEHGAVNHNRTPAVFYYLRGHCVRFLTRHQVFIHELQAEPWADRPILEVPLEEQLKLFNSDTFCDNIAFAKKVNLNPTYIWGLEWWYWLKIRHRSPNLWEAAGNAFWNDQH